MSEPYSPSFPFTVKLFDFTLLVLRALRHGALFPLANQYGTVLSASLDLYSSLVLFFAETYIKEGYTLSSMHLCQPLVEAKVADSTAVIDVVSRYYVGLKDLDWANRLERLIRDRDQPKGK
jgi:hypothetical protein